MATHLGCCCHSLSVSVCKRRTRSREGAASSSGSSHEYACVSGSRNVVLCVRSNPFRSILERCAAVLSSNWDAASTETLGSSPETRRLSRCR